MNRYFKEANLLMVIIIIYWGLIFYALLLTTIKILASKYKGRFDLLDTLANTGFAAPILIMLIFVFGLIGILLQLNILLLIRIFFPVLYGLLLYVLLTWSFESVLDYIDFKLNLNTIGYITLTLWASIYAHTSILKTLYIECLELTKYFFKIPLADDIIEKEKEKVSNSLFRIHIYILLFIFYFLINTLDFSNISNKVHVSFITEALLTFVMIDTILTNRTKLIPSK